jgi:hypothetical protein
MHQMGRVVERHWFLLGSIGQTLSVTIFHQLIIDMHIPISGRITQKDRQHTILKEESNGVKGFWSAVVDYLRVVNRS